ncbi:MAG: methyltransferase domain-containing protein [candidate division WOR-3 bacterium]
MSKKSKPEQFNKKAASVKYKPQEVIKSLGIKPGDIIADIGAGGGFYTFEFAQKVTETGKVYALDTESSYVEYIKNQIQARGLKNVEAVLVKNDDIGLTEHSIDLMFLRNVYHHLPEPIKYFARLKKYLKPHGRIAIIEYNKPRPFFFRLFHRGRHHTPEAEIVNTLIRCGFVISNRFDFLADQSFVIFRKE